jgi:glycosyltransferase involved in cell wall biosynthesis
MQKSNSFRVAFIGNMNNNHFAMARYLRDAGYDCHLLLFPQEADHFHPSCDTYSLGYREWIYQMPWGGRSNFLNGKPIEIRDFLSKFDLLVGCGLAPALCDRAGIKLDVFIPYGGDLWWETRYSLHRSLLHSAAATSAQRNGLASVSIVHAVPMIESYEMLLSQYWRGKTRWYEGEPIVYAPEYSHDNLATMMTRSHWANEFRRIREGCDFMMVAPGRHVWGGKKEPNAKGNDILLEGWSMFKNQAKSYRAKLVLLEYGENVDFSKEMVHQLGLVDSVEWLPRMQRKDIMPGLLLADAVAGEFVHSWIAGGVIYEALVAKKPLIMHRNDSELDDRGKSLFPVFKASNPEEVATQLQFLASNPSIAKEKGQEGSEWYRNHVARAGIDRYINLIENIGVTSF